MRAPVLLLLTVLLGAPLSARADDLIVLLEARSCPNCELADADLIHADLRNADLTAADLQRANLGRARLDEPTPRRDLRFSSLKEHHYAAATSEHCLTARICTGRSSGASISRMSGATGRAIALTKARSAASPDEAQAGRWPQAEHLFEKQSSGIRSP